MNAVTESEAPIGASAWTGFAAMCLGMFMAILDVQVVATSLPTIQKALAITPDRMSWIQTAYLIAEIISIPLTGYLMRVFTMRWLFVGAVALFTLASIACGEATSFPALIAFRVVQGFAGGSLIPSVFSAIFLLFPLRSQPLAATLAGMLAVLAPTLGPVVGGWITDTYTWPWLFRINVGPGIAAAALAAMTLPKARPAFGELRRLDGVALGLVAVALAALEVAIKEAPQRGWTAPLVSGLLAVFVATSAAFIVRTLRAPQPLVELRTFADRNFSIGCLLSFVFGMGLYGSVYLMPIFLAYVRGHNAFAIGRIMLVTGVTQLCAAPVAAALVRRVDVRILTAFGFALFAAGLFMSADQTRLTDFSQMFWPQVARGAAIMFCIIPPTELALGRLGKTVVADASGLFNLMRNLGGAIGIAAIDTIIDTRAPEHAQQIVHRLMAGDLATATALGIPADTFGPALLEPANRAAVSSLVNTLAYVEAVNDAWAVLAVATAVVTVAVLLARRVSAGADIR
jgi:DHA2 family multidrug resistance protein